MVAGYCQLWSWKPKITWNRQDGQENNIAGSSVTCVSSTRQPRSFAPILNILFISVSNLGRYGEVSAADACPKLTFR